VSSGFVPRIASDVYQFLGFSGLICGMESIRGKSVSQAEAGTLSVGLAPERTWPLAVAVLLIAGGLGGMSFVVPDPQLRLILLLTGSILCGVALIQSGLAILRRGIRRRLHAGVMAFVENDGTASYVTDEEGAILSFNRAASARTRAGGQPTLAQALGDLVSGPGAVLFRLQALAKTQGFAREDVVSRRGHLRLSVHRIEGGYLWRIEDLGERMAAGRSADALSLPMLTAGPSGTILYMNEAFRRLTGGRARTLDRVFRDLPLVSGRVHQVDGTAGAVDCLVAQVAGSAGRREIYLLPAASAGPGQVRAAGWESIEDLPVPLLKVAPTGQVLASNREARALLPMPIGPETRLSDLLEGLGRPLIDWLAEVAEGRAVPGPQFLRGTGAYQDTFVQVSLNLAGPADDLHLIAVMNDVTELKSLEAQFVQSQKMQAIGQLAGGVAHDFNNLLTAISGHCDLLLLRHDQGDPEYGDLIQIHQNANRAASLVGQLLAFSRKQNLQPEVLDLRDTLSDLTHLLNRLVGERVTLSLNHDPALNHIRADRRQLEQVLMNLVVNARDAMPGGGEIRVETENTVLPLPLERDRATVPAGSYVIVRVIDEGTGIAPEKLPKIFEPFYTTKRPGEGTGLGLSTAYGIVKQTGGFIFADSEPDVGTTFSLYFPSYDKPAAVAPQPTPAIAPAPQRKGEGVVLLVEDEAPVRAFASRALRLRGYSVLEADSAEAALVMLADPALTVDIFVTDVIMPGKDGPTWVREALKDRPETKVVFVSGYAEDAFGEQKALIPNSVFLPKPFSLNDLTATVQQQLH
jgi:two-component system, cell cycle sensor histidine kinase and response regulator CckA